MSANAYVAYTPNLNPRSLRSRAPAKPVAVFDPFLCFIVYARATYPYTDHRAARFLEGTTLVPLRSTRIVRAVRVSVKPKVANRLRFLISPYDTNVFSTRFSLSH